MSGPSWTRSQVLQLNENISLRISSNQNYTIFFEAQRESFHLNLADSKRPKSARVPIISQLGFLQSAYDSFLSETSKEHFPLGEDCELEKSAWVEGISRRILAKTEHIENLAKMQQRNRKRAQNCLRHLVECVRDQTGQRVNNVY